MSTQADINRYMEQAESGDTIAMRKLGLAYFNGDGVEKDIDKAESYFFRSVWGGNIYAAYNMSKLLVGKGKTNNHCYNEAFFYALHGAKAGDANCQTAVASYYMGEQEYAKASMIPPNWYTANLWYQKAAEQGNSNAMYSLGYNYHLGLGCESNMHSAINWWNLAAEKDFLPAIKKLAQTYHGDFGGRYAIGNLAGHWLYEAAKRGEDDCKEVLNYFYQYDEKNNRWRKIR